MEKKHVYLVILIVIIVSTGFIIGLYLVRDLDKDNNGDDDDNGSGYPDTLPLGTSPVLELPYNTTEYIWFIGGFNSLHQGIDLCVNHSVGLVAIHDAYVTVIRTFYNHLGDHWNTNILFRLNDDWIYEYKLEPSAQDFTNATYQENNLTINVGNKVLKNQSIGILLYLDQWCHIDYTLYYRENPVCQYSYFSADAKAEFDPLFVLYGSQPNPCQ